MLSCPRCGTGNLKEGRSLSMHLTSPSLLFHAQRGTLAKKCSHELMLSGSCPSTYQQQIRNFNSLMVNVSVPTINILHGMPSLSHLSSTQSELGTCKGPTKRTLCGIILFKLNTFLVRFLHVPSIDSTCFLHM
jgi:hypothetical protein